ncbi:hypothetical protein BKP56_05180 [Marinilactibacillus sp. 15R]|uniref:Cof-type HAD-IIB family hydrolase n=1 Tax=Marinilactibacillus sp. 15R TaxID=1911586 RepID=UPI00090CC94B|nr:Cof-type HAD-IIB family hydrolase [Marinilactibacillus sp. 15R]API88717.1 hypothetical protein BKP56_05180 [Marinilactibacillus sp. 15R]
MTVKLVAIDLDGTLVNSEGIVSNRNIETLRKVSQSEIIVVIATGRSPNSAKYIIEEILQIKGYYISLNGAFIGESYTSRPIQQTFISYNDVKETLIKVKQLGIGIVCNAGFNSILFNNDKETHPLFNSAFVYSDLKECMKMIQNSYPINKLSIHHADKDILKYMREFWNDIGLEATQSDKDYIEAMRKECSKGNSLKKLAKNFNIELEDVLCIGDQENDIEMIKSAGIGIAMENAIQKLKNSANYITSSNDNDGVSKALEKFI